MIMKKIYMKPALNVEQAQHVSIICTSTINTNVGLNYSDDIDETPRAKELGADNSWDGDW